MDSTKKYYTPDEVAERYDVTGTTVRRWIKQGLFPGTMKKSPLPRSDWMIPESAIEHFDEQRKAASQPD